MILLCLKSHLTKISDVYTSQQPSETMDNIRRYWENQTNMQNGCPGLNSNLLNLRLIIK